MRPGCYRRGGRAASGVVLGCLLLATAGPLAGQSRYIAFGDSITEGDGFDEPERECPDECGYPPRLEELLQAAGEEAQVVNAGLGGETTAEGLSRLDQVLEREGGDVLLLMEGTNDISRGISPETLRFNLEEMARRAGARGLTTVHATPIPRIPRAKVDPENEVNRQAAWAIREMAFDEGRDLADPFEVFGARPDPFGTLYYDGKDPVGHPNPDGFDLLARVFFDVLRGVDSVPPVPGDLAPAAGSEGVSPLATVHLRLLDFGAGLDPATAELLLDGRPAPASIQGDGRRIELRFTPSEPLEGRVEVGYRAEDLAAQANRSERTVGSFFVAGSGPVAGDLDGDGRVDGLDLIGLARSFGSRDGENRYRASADLNDDGLVDGNDLAVLAENFGRSSG